VEELGEDYCLLDFGSDSEMNLFPVDIIGVTNEHGGGSSKTIPAPTISHGVCDSHEQQKRNTTTLYPNTR
jgi:hypothetical protein